MITRIEIDGFKTFQDFAVDLAPFQVIIGPNGCGKSNFFDALDLLSKLADMRLDEAFQSVRGNINELFTLLPNGKQMDRMRFTVEMLVDKNFEDDWESKQQVQHRRLRYNLEFAYGVRERGVEELYTVREELRNIPAEADTWLQRYDLPGSFASALKDGISDGNHEGIAYIYTVSENNEVKFILNFYSGERPEIRRSTPMSGVRTILSMVDSVNPVHVFAARQELRSLKLLRLATQELRKPSHYIGEQNVSATGDNLPGTLARMQTLDKRLLKSVSRDVSNIVPNFSQIEVDRDEGRKQIALYAHTRDKRRFSIDALSEGTLRILALATLRNDPQLHGTICFEDPEMGVHPGALERIVKLLRGMATDLNDPEDLKLPLRQVLVTTHSPELVSHLNIEQGELLFVTTPTRVMPGGDAWQVTRFTSVCADNKQGPDQTYALSNVIEYLNNPDAAAKRESLRETMRR